MRRLSWLLLLVIALSLVAVGCSGTNARAFVPLPPPVGASYVLNIQQLKVGKNAQIMSVNSPHIEVAYRENGRGAGRTATEIVAVSGYQATMTETTWGDWEKATLTLNEYAGRDQQLLRGLVTLRFDDASILQVFTGHGRYTVDRSYLTLMYEIGEDGTWPTLVNVTYTELWGFKRSHLFGGTAVWEKNLRENFPRYYKWGFWEVDATPADVVAKALETAVASKLSGMVPNYELIDEDSSRELIGRQTGMILYQNGVRVGKVILDYRNGWGRQPNTELIGRGALSRVEWRFNGQYYALLLLAPVLSPKVSTRYLVVDDEQVADQLQRENPLRLYPQLRSAAGIPHVFLAVHAMGDIGSISARVTGGEGGSVDIGDEGGVQFRTLGNPAFADAQLARNLLAMLGKSGQKGLGLYYAYAQGSGSGLNYYLAALNLVLADPEIVLSQPGTDVSVLDTVHIPDLAVPPFVQVGD